MFNYISTPNSLATIFISLSPLPERLTIIVLPLFSSFLAYLIAYAIACALSSAGITPSTSHNVLNPLSASSLLTDTYSARLILSKYACSGPTPG